MKTLLRTILVPAAAALAVAVPAVLAGPALAEGNAGSARYEAYIAAEAQANAATRANGHAAKQVTRIGDADSSVIYMESGAKRFHLDTPKVQEQHYRGN
jgi:hypothetical protein